MVREVAKHANPRWAIVLTIGFFGLASGALVLDQVLHTMVLAGLAGCWYIAAGGFAFRTLARRAGA